MSFSPAASGLIPFGGLFRQYATMERQVLPLGPQLTATYLATLQDAAARLASLRERLSLNASLGQGFGALFGGESVDTEKLMAALGGMRASDRAVAYGKMEEVPEGERRAVADTSYASASMGALPTVQVGPLWNQFSHQIDHANSLEDLDQALVASGSGLRMVRFFDATGQLNLSDLALVDSTLADTARRILLRMERILHPQFLLGIPVETIAGVPFGEPGLFLWSRFNALRDRLMPGVAAENALKNFETITLGLSTADDLDTMAGLVGYAATVGFTGTAVTKDKIMALQAALSAEKDEGWALRAWGCYDAIPMDIPGLEQGLLRVMEGAGLTVEGREVLEAVKPPPFPLVIFREDEPGERTLADGERIVIGRHGKNNPHGITFNVADDTYVSSRPAVLRREANRVLVEVPGDPKGGETPWVSLVRQECDAVGQPTGVVHRQPVYRGAPEREVPPGYEVHFGAKVRFAVEQSVPVGGNYVTLGESGGEPSRRLVPIPTEVKARPLPFPLPGERVITLQVKDEGGVSQDIQIPLRDGVVVNIGRVPASGSHDIHIPLQGRSASRRPVRLEVRGGKVVVTAPDSHYKGVWLNGNDVRIEPGTDFHFEHGDALRVGDFEIVLEDTGQVAPAKIPVAIDDSAAGVLEKADLIQGREGQALIDYRLQGNFRTHASGVEGALRRVGNLKFEPDATLEVVVIEGEHEERHVGTLRLVIDEERFFLRYEPLPPTVDVEPAVEDVEEVVEVVVEVEPEVPGPAVVDQRSPADLAALAAQMEEAGFVGLPDASALDAGAAVARGAALAPGFEARPAAAPVPVVERPAVATDRPAEVSVLARVAPPTPTPVARAARDDSEASRLFGVEVLKNQDGALSLRVMGRQGTRIRISGEQRARVLFQGPPQPGAVLEALDGEENVVGRFRTEGEGVHVRLKDITAEPEAVAPPAAPEVPGARTPIPPPRPRWIDEKRVDDPRLGGYLMGGKPVTRSVKGDEVLVKGLVPRLGFTFKWIPNGETAMRDVIADQQVFGRGYVLLVIDPALPFQTSVVAKAIIVAGANPFQWEDTARVAPEPLGSLAAPPRVPLSPLAEGALRAGIGREADGRADTAGGRPAHWSHSGGDAPRRPAPPARERQVFRPEGMDTLFEGKVHEGPEGPSIAVVVPPGYQAAVGRHLYPSGRQLIPLVDLRGGLTIEPASHRASGRQRTFTVIAEGDGDVLIAKK